MTLREELIQVAAVAVAIVQDLDNGSTMQGKNYEWVRSVLREVDDERDRQEQKWGPQHHTPEEWLAILAEEVGEAAREVEVTPHQESIHVKWWLAKAEVHARAFLKERFGPDPVLDPWRYGPSEHW